MELTLKRIMNFVGKYRYVALILLIGVIFMLLPTSVDNDEQTDSVQETVHKADLAEDLAQILAQIKGVGKVQVMLTVDTGQVTVYQKDETDTVIITDADRTQHGLVEKVITEQYRGAVIVCQGADSPSVRLCVIEAVSNATGLSSDRITVLKMK